MMTLLSTTGWAVMDNFIEALIPIAIVVVLPVLIVWIVMRARQHEVDKKTEILLKAVENGTQVDPSFFESAGPRKKTAKDKLMGYLTAAMVTGIIGLITLVIQILMYSKLGMFTQKNEMLVLPLTLSGIILAVGLAFFVVYFVGKKTYAKELKEE